MPPRFARRIEVNIFFCIMEIFEPLKTRLLHAEIIHQFNEKTAFAKISWFFQTFDAKESKLELNHRKRNGVRSSSV